MRNNIGQYTNTINPLILEDRILTHNTLIIAEVGSGKTNLACRIRNFAIDSDVPTIYFDFNNPFEEEIELRYKDEHFNYIKFEDFLLYLLSFSHLQRFGFTFLAQPHTTFENQHLKLLFTFLYLGRCSNTNYFNTAIIKTLGKNEFYYQHRTAHQTLLFNSIKSNIVKIDEYILED